MRIPYYGARRAFVTQIGQLKVLTLIRSIGLLQMTPGCPSSAHFASPMLFTLSGKRKFPQESDLLRLLGGGADQLPTIVLLFWIPYGSAFTIGGRFTLLT